MINKVLIANRGEIAVRIIRTCKKLGIKSVAVYSDVDRGSLFTKLADEAYHIGGNAPGESYLLSHKIVEVAKSCGADAIHPGYGFLSENASFSSMVTAAGISFLGPSATAIEMMGNKIAAKEAVQGFNVPLVPGSDGAIEDKSAAKKIAANIGYPVLIKAAAGGGGKGMRIVHHEGEFDESFDRARSEAISAFNDGSVFIEKYVVKPRHIEIQVIADNHGNVCHLLERECSIQRRHQKVIEEAPSSVLSEHLRRQMGAAAISVAKACNYSGVGTVEFLVDVDYNFYFLEMNTRLQVEHAVTEMVTGLDLVEWQIRIANGEYLGFQQEDIKPQGHSIELRVYAEDSFNQFFPSIGKLSTYREPIGEGIRVDSGYEEGNDISIYYDPLIAKLVVWAENRPQAISKMITAIADFQIAGVENTLPFGLFVMNQPDFIAGDFDTSFVEKYFTLDVQNDMIQKDSQIAGIMAQAIHNSSDYGNYNLVNSNWKLRRS